MMKKLVSLVLLLLLLSTGCSNASDNMLRYASDASTLKDEVQNLIEPTVSDSFSNEICVIPTESTLNKDNHLPALSTLIINSTKNKLIYANNIYERVFPASITKIVTALVVLKYADLSDMVTFSQNATNITEQGAKLCGFKEGDTIKLEDLLTSLLVYSGNDAGIAIAEHVSGSVESFAKLMNEEVYKLGAVDSHFVNPHGLHDDNNYTTAYDLYLIFHELIKDERFVRIINTVDFTAHYTSKDGGEMTKVFDNTNRYLKGTEKLPDGITVIGGKTGTTQKAGSCLILYSKDNKDNDYISLVLKADNGDMLFNQMTYMLELIP